MLLVLGSQVGIVVLLSLHAIDEEPPESPVEPAFECTQRAHDPGAHASVFIGIFRAAANVSSVGHVILSVRIAPNRVKSSCGV